MNETEIYNWYNSYFLTYQKYIQKKDGMKWKYLE